MHSRWLAVASSLALSLVTLEASADMMCGGSRRPPDPPPRGSSSPRTQPVGELELAPESPHEPRTPAAPVELGMMAGMVLLGGGAAKVSRGKKKKDEKR